MKELFDAIQSTYNEIPQAQRAVAQYVMEHYQNIPFLSVTAMAKEIGVSDTTIIKYCMQLGLSGFSEFKRIVTDYVQNQASWYNQLQNSLHQIKEQDAYAAVYNSELSNLQATMTNPLNRECYDKLLPLIDEAENIYILGFRSSAYPAQFMALGLGQQGYRTFPISPGIGDRHDIACRMTSSDLLISFCFSRYAKEAVNVVKFAAAGHVPHVAFTDSLLSPTAIRADATFLCFVQAFSNAPSLTSAYALINAVLAGCAQRHPEQAKERMRLLEDFISSSGLYYTMEPEESNGE